MDKKKAIILGVVVAAVAAYFLFFKKKEDVEVVAPQVAPEKSHAEIVDEVSRQAAEADSKKVGAAKEAVVMSQRDSNYNTRRQVAEMTYGIVVDDTWDINMIEQQITLAQQKRDALDLYLANNKSADYNVVSNWDITRLESETKKLQNQKQEDWQKRKAQIDKIVGDVSRVFQVKYADIDNNDYGKAKPLELVKPLQLDAEKAYFLRKFGVRDTKYRYDTTATKKADFVGCCENYLNYLPKSKSAALKNTLTELSAKFTGVDANADIVYETLIGSTVPE